MELLTECPVCGSKQIAPPTKDADYYLCINCKWKSTKSTNDLRVLETFFKEHALMAATTEIPTHISRRSYYTIQVQKALAAEDFSTFFMFAAALASTRSVNLFKVLERKIHGTADSKTN